jgi:hypothetical protein
VEEHVEALPARDVVQREPALQQVAAVGAVHDGDPFPMKGDVGESCGVQESGAATCASRIGMPLSKLAVRMATSTVLAAGRSRR